MTKPSNPSGASKSHGAAARDPKEARLRRPPGGDTVLEPGLYVVAAPIGNLRDITLRALDVLAGVDRLYVEDTRVARKLLDAHGVKPKFLGQYHEYNAESAREEILEALERGEAVALMSDAGTPLVSDPGFKLARAVAAEGGRIVPIPGPSALLAALVGAGLPTDRFLFAGFPPPKSAGRRSVFEELRETPASLIFYETGPRLAESLADMADVLGPRPAAVARELTKMFEEFRRAPLDELAAHYAEAGAPKGEIVVVVGPPLEQDADPEALDAFLREALKRGGVKEAANEAAEKLGVSKRDAYARALQLKDNV
jgi:16S rRNA (cytidine1402-2'-O)-methyltransferase